jgi:tRNA A64-2'-O-ribosylphosphate transferase
VIICWNPSHYKYAVNDDTEILQGKQVLLKKNHIQFIEEEDFYYSPGAADDHESWGRRLTPNLFWKHTDELLNAALSDEQEVDETIDKIMSAAKNDYDDGVNNITPKVSTTNVFLFCDQIGKLNLWVGSRKAGRPPECWNEFDAILNVTTQQYCENDDGHHFYLQLPVEEGKRDKHELEKWMPVGLVFLIHHLQQGRRILVHCAQGKDRSVACVLVFVILACTLYFPLELKSDFSSWDFSTLQQVTFVDDSPSKVDAYFNSGLSNNLVQHLLDKEGKETFLRWIHEQLGRDVEDGPLANKDTVRIALHLIRQDREVAEPTRSTMQKINRFLMSSTIYQQ